MCLRMPAGRNNNYILIGGNVDKKKELEHQIQRYETVRDCAEERLNEPNIQLREAKKPELRHGGFGYFKDGTPRICIKDVVYDKLGRCGNSRDIEYYNIFGNIFDLLSAWSERPDVLKAHIEILLEKAAIRQ